MNPYNLQSEHPERVILGMGCFWGPESRFGSLPGVINTVVGYAGGSTLSPTYRNIGNHTETVEIIFDPAILSFEELMQIFWQSHDAAKDRFYKERQYISLAIFEKEKHMKAAEKIKQAEEERCGKELYTEFQLKSLFYPAETHHQKYFLRRFKKALETVQTLFPDEETFNCSTIAARLNGFVRENGSLPEIKAEIKNWGLAEEDYQRLMETVDALKW